MTQGTRFAWITDSSVPRTGAEWDHELLRTERFVAVPSVGALVAGWTLVVPRRPLLSLSQSSNGERAELAGVVDAIALALKPHGGQVFCFEHGSRETGSLTGCGVDQAHLHVVPLTFDLIEAAARHADGSVIWGEPRRTSAPLELLPQRGDYIAIWRNADRLTIIGNVRRPTSQWVRRVIAEELGMGSEWDYRTHPQPHNVALTLAMLAEIGTSLAQ